MASVREDLASRPAPLEYWFIKLYSGDLAFLVDFIVRRAVGQAEVRVSLWVRGSGRVLRDRAASWESGDAITIAENVLDAGHCSGRVDDVEWSLTYEPAEGRAAPRVPVLSRLHPFDLDIVSRPRVAFAGHVTVAGERFDCAQASGCLTHYWGRRLPDRWHWISAGGVDADEVAVEAVAMRTRLWGLGPNVAVGYLWTRQEGRERTLISPLTGLISVVGGVDDYHLVARGPGRTVRLRCVAAPDRYNDLGEGIHQTLLGSCALVDHEMPELRAGLEYRVSPMAR